MFSRKLVYIAILGALSAIATTNATAQDPGLIVLDTVFVDSQRSYDALATENTNDYTSPAATVGTKIPAPMREIPQSISIITSQQVKDRNVDTLDVRDLAPSSAVAVGAVYGDQSAKEGKSHSIVLLSQSRNRFAPSHADNAFYTTVRQEVMQDDSFTAPLEAAVKQNTHISCIAAPTSKKEADHTQTAKNGLEDTGRGKGKLG